LLAGFPAEFGLANILRVAITVSCVTVPVITVVGGLNEAANRCMAFCIPIANTAVIPAIVSTVETLSADVCPDEINALNPAAKSNAPVRNVSQRSNPSSLSCPVTRS